MIGKLIGWPVWIAVVLTLCWSPGAGAARVIFLDDFEDVGDENPLNDPLVGSWDAAETDARGKTSGSVKAMWIYGQLNFRQAFGNATRPSPAGTPLRFEWTWKLEGNDNEGIVYAPYVGLAFNTYSRAVAVRIVYTGSATNEPTHADLRVERWNPGLGDTEDVDTGFDVPITSDFRQWSIDYTVGESNAVLNVAGVVTNYSMPVAFPGQTISGVYFHRGSQLTNTQFDDVTLTDLAAPSEVAIITNLVEDTFALAFTSEVGTVYNLQSTTNSVTTPYASTGATIEGDGNVVQMFDPTGFDASKSYRVVATE
jgi:hypothetical protein